MAGWEGVPDSDITTLTRTRLSIFTSDPASLGTFSHHHPSLSWRQQLRGSTMPAIPVSVLRYVMSADSQAY